MAHNIILYEGKCTRTYERHLEVGYCTCTCAVDTLSMLPINIQWVCAKLPLKGGHLSNWSTSYWCHWCSRQRSFTAICTRCKSLYISRGVLTRSYIRVTIILSCGQYVRNFCCCAHLLLLSLQKQYSTTVCLTVS